MTNMKPADAMLVWLDAVPLEELDSEDAVRIVKGYREGKFELSRALPQLWELCYTELTEWVHFNFELRHIDLILNEEKGY